MTEHRIRFEPEGPVAHLSPDVMDVVWSSAAAVVNTIKAEAWAEGYGLGRDDEAAADPTRPNPYVPLSRSRKE